MMDFLPGVARNTLFLFLNRVVVTGINFVVAVYVMRYLGPAQLGTYATVFAFLAFFSVFTIGSGVDHILVREVSKGGSEDVLRKKITSAIVLRLLLGALGFLIASGSCSLIYGSADVSSLILLSSFSLLFAFYETQSPFTVHYNVQLNLLTPQLIALALSIISVAVKLFLVFGIRAPLIAFILLDAGIPVVTSLAYLLLYSSNWGTPFRRSDVSWAEIGYFLKESAPMFVSQLCIMSYLRLDQILISKWLGPEPLGNYSVAVQLSEVFDFIPIYLAVSLLPVFTKTVGDEGDDRLYGIPFRFLNMVIVPVILFCSLFPGELILFLFGPQFAAAAQPFRVLIWSEFFLFGGVIYACILLARGLQRYSMLLFFVQAATNALVNVLVLKKFSIVGASWASVISYGAGFLASLFIPGLRRYLRIYVHASAPFLVVALAFFLLGQSLPILPKGLIVVAGTIVLFAVAMRRHDVEVLRKIWAELKRVGRHA